MDISAKEVMKLRKMSGAGMMDCKKALIEMKGDAEAAMDFLRTKGLKTAEKRAGREVNEGKVVAFITDDSRGGTLLEFNSETDFVSGTPEFVQFARDCAKCAYENRPADVEALLAMNASSSDGSFMDQLNSMTAKLGEKMTVNRFTTFEIPEGRQGRVQSYIHLGDKHGVLMAVTCDKPETSQAPVFQELVNDLALQVVAFSPSALDRSSVDSSLVERELAVYRDQALAEGKPEKIIDRIAEGKLNKYYSDVTLLEQAFVKADKISVQDHVKVISKQHDDTIVIESFDSFTIGQ
jgi:elongation factor Ts